VVGDDDTVQKEINYVFVGSNLDKIAFRKQGLKALTNYWRITTENTQTKENKAMFPEALPRKAIRLMTDENDLILDCFGGMGTTLIAAEKTKRKARIIELDESLCSFIIERWENLTGKTAVKIK